MERVTRIELALSAWEADVLPLNYTRVIRTDRPRRVRCPDACSLYIIVGPRCPDPGGWVGFSGVSGCGRPELGRTVEPPGGAGVPPGESSL